MKKDQRRAPAARRFEKRFAQKKAVMWNLFTSREKMKDCSAMAYAFSAMKVAYTIKNNYINKFTSNIQAESGRQKGLPDN
jgi:hypothetical protein